MKAKQSNDNKKGAKVSNKKAGDGLLLYKLNSEAHCMMHAHPNK
jgi:hypothetical protein